ncbi:cytosolic phospholipase A2 gamma-like [Amia ocellicauda]|uniref:cytosolic phospholipase A2 gamma-like n=1 Tax=Amia ocellicauda TaxID=2972642 RepID=UPI003464A872
MSSLYSDENWSTQVGQKESEMVQALTNENISFHDILTRINKASNDSNFSLTDVWTALFVYPAVKWKETKYVSEQTDEKMVNPYPIYAAIDRWRLENKDQHDKGIWFEITCHKSGYPGCGAFVETSKFGSFFKEGEILQQQDEMDLLYLQGLCGSALGSWVEDKKYMITYIKDWLKSIPWFKHKSKVDPSVECLLLLLDLHEALSDGTDCKHILSSLMVHQKDHKKAQKLMQQVLHTWDLNSKDTPRKLLSDLCQEMSSSFIGKWISLERQGVSF